MARTKHSSKLRPDTPSKRPRDKASRRRAPTVRKKRRNHPGTVSAREVRKFQRTGEMLMQHAPWKRLLRHLLDEADVPAAPIDAKVTRIQKGADAMLQTLYESQHVALYKKAGELARHAKRTTVMPRDVELAIKQFES